jgi:hypothetical protein
MPPVDSIETATTDLDTATIAGGLVSHLRDPLKGSELIRDLNKILAPSGLCLGHRLLNAEDLALRLSVTKTEAKDFLNTHGDVQCGRWWRMSEARFNECVRNGRFRRKP